jgi:hypothetical protein
MAIFLKINFKKLVIYPVKMVDKFGQQPGTGEESFIEVSNLSVCNLSASGTIFVRRGVPRGRLIGIHDLSAQLGQEIFPSFRSHPPPPYASCPSPTGQGLLF